VIVRQALLQSHRLLFGHEMTLTMRRFLRHLSYSLIGYVVGNAILFAAVVLAGRLLGPIAFGQYALVMALAQIFVIPMLPGTDMAVMRETALHQGRARSQVLSSGLVFASVTSVVAAATAFAFAGKAAGWLGLNVTIWRVAVVVALALVVRTFFDGVVRGKGDWRLQMAARVIDSSMVLGVFTVSFWLFGVRDFRALAAGIFAGALIAGLIFFDQSVRGHLARAAVSSRMIGILWRYGRFGVMGAIGGILLASADKVLLGKFLGTRDLGIYQAYYFASVQLTGQLALIFLNVFFPTVVRQRDLTIVLRKLDRLVAIFFLPSLIAVAGFVTVTLWLFSGEFSLDWRLIFLMSLYSLLWFLYMVYWTLMASTGPGGMLYASSTGLVAGGLYLSVVYRLVNDLNIFAPGVAFVGTFVFMMVTVILWRLRFRHTLH
jgi:O-antigen/teichoic acid export membrane protein